MLLFLLSAFHWWPFPLLLPFCLPWPLIFSEAFCFAKNDPGRARPCYLASNSSASWLAQVTHRGSGSLLLLALPEALVLL